MRSSYSSNEWRSDVFRSLQSTVPHQTGDEMTDEEINQNPLLIIARWLLRTGEQEVTAEALHDVRHVALILDIDLANAGWEIKKVTK